MSVVTNANIIRKDVEENNNISFYGTFQQSHIGIKNSSKDFSCNLAT